ncbi:hypothetical protein SK128_017362 [Halocaridina rubra]|uniref:Uncharacterized protein n=1 Tax=Halocaridina rubra TaxID=373956 RepID=A0AAN9A2M1_HALRR
MHLKENNVNSGGLCLLPQDGSKGIEGRRDSILQNTGSHSPRTVAKSANKNNNTIDNDTAVIINNNNNNYNNNISVNCGKDSPPLLIIEKDSSGGIQVEKTCLPIGDDGMLDPSPSSSLPDLSSENVSSSSDQLHHPSISSGGQARHIRSSSNCSISSFDNDESDLESYSSLEVDIPKRDIKNIKASREKDSKKFLDFDVLGYRSRRPSSSSGSYQDSEGWPADSGVCSQASLQCNDLSPDFSLSCSNNNDVNDLAECGAFVKSFYDKPKLQLITDVRVNNTPGDDNGNITVAEENNSTEEICSEQTHIAESTDITSDDENPTDIEQKMAETKVKMNDAILSNGKEDLSLHGRKLKQYMKQKELMEACAAASGIKLSNMKQPNSLKISDSNDGDNRYTQVPESPIVDAYEKECLDVPEKMVRELENHSKESADSGIVDEFIPYKKEKMEINEHNKKFLSSEHDNEIPTSNIQGQQGIVVQRPDVEANKENAVPLSSEMERSRVSRVTFGGVEEVEVRRRDNSLRRRERAALRKSVPQAASGFTTKDRTKLGSPDGGEYSYYYIHVR